MSDIMPNIDDTYLAVIGTIFGGAGLKVVEALIGKARQRQDHGAVIREEQRKEIASLRDELAKAKVEEQRLEAEVEGWRAKYYEQFVQISAKSTDLTLAQDRVAQLQKSLEELKIRLAQLEVKLNSQTEKW